MIARAARAHGWTLVGGVGEAFAGHGICARPAQQVWVRTLAQSWFWLGGAPSSRIAGTLHPNRSGHRAIARRIVPSLFAVLGTTVVDGGDDHRIRPTIGCSAAAAPRCCGSLPPRLGAVGAVTLRSGRRR